ncbi:low-temperature-induced 65 kDa protein-like [Hibiscus syriacus]|uniref:low-temperature-induced 65 kDa protein-like n=1 Tax=Hibiscus syriacus TaxID=106335 RepID=UPI00192515E1|nr:low-temperature-induced 65 kDa protein-like [Hibiscus syriacus]
MDTQSAYDTNIRHQHGEDDDDQHHEKHSVLEKVKAKAKKMKDTIKKHGPGHHHEGHIPDDHDLDEEDDDEEEEEIVQDPEVHGGPMYESAAVKNVVSGQPEDLSRTGITNFDRLDALPTDPLASRERKRTVGGLEAPLMREQPRVGFGKTTDTVGEPPAPLQNTPFPSSYQVKDDNPSKTFVHGVDEYPGQPKVNLQRPKGLEEDATAPKDTADAYSTTNYQTKVTDPTREGGEATGIAPILHSMDKMKIYDENDTGKKRNVDKPMNQSSYTEKISSATSAIAEKAVSAKNIVASKLGYGEKDPTTANELREGRDTTKQASATKLHGSGSGTATEVETEQVKDRDKGVSVKSYIAEKFKPGDDDRALSEVISETFQKRKEDTPSRGKVTESEEVANRLGTGDGTNERVGSGSMNSPTNSVVDKLKGAVGSWFGSDTTGSSNSGDSRTLQESGN